MASEREAERPVKIWDVPTRLFHWTLAGLIAATYVAQEAGRLQLHMTIGYVILTLVLFRLLWGLVGSRPSRFATFVPTPRRLARYSAAFVRGRPPSVAGHNPLGAVLIYAMLALVAVQAGSGLFANDDIFTEGPLAKLVSDDASDRLTALHETSFWILIGLIAVHIAANTLYEVVLRQPLIQAMISGTKPLPADEPAPPLRPAWWALPVLAVAAVVVWYVVTRV